MSRPACRFRRVTDALLVVVLVALGSGGLGGCGGPSDSSNAESSSSTSLDSPVSPADTPEFTGPWADDFLQLYQTADDIGRQILADGIVSEQEYLDISSRIDECFEARGYRVVRETDGGMSLEDTRGRGGNAPIGEDAGACQNIGGGVDRLYLDIQRNPENEDTNELMAACLVDGGLVDSSFTKDDYIAAMESSLLPWPVNDPVFQACLADPLG